MNILDMVNLRDTKVMTIETAINQDQQQLKNECQMMAFVLQ